MFALFAFDLDYLTEADKSGDKLQIMSMMRIIESPFRQNDTNPLHSR